MKTDELSYREITLNSRQLEVPREAYQRELNTTRVHKIAAEFDERIANEPKVSCRNGHYYVFDGQHTIAARKHRNKGRDLPIRCKVSPSRPEHLPISRQVPKSGLWFLQVIRKRQPFSRRQRVPGCDWITDSSVGRSGWPALQRRSRNSIRSARSGIRKLFPLFWRHGMEIRIPFVQRQSRA